MQTSDFLTAATLPIAAWIEVFKEFEQTARRLQDICAKYNNQTFQSIGGSPVSHKKKKRKREHDDNAPKRGKSAYMYFCQEKRPKAKADHPNMTPQEIVSYLGSQWKTLKEEAKKPYSEKAAAAKLIYEAATKKYQQEKKEGEIKSPKQTSNSTNGAPPKTKKKEKKTS